MSKKKKKITKLIAAHVPAAVHAALKVHAAKRKMSVSAVVHQIIEELLERWTSP